MDIPDGQTDGQTGQTERGKVKCQTDHFGKKREAKKTN